MGNIPSTTCKYPPGCRNPTRSETGRCHLHPLDGSPIPLSPLPLPGAPGSGMTNATAAATFGHSKTAEPSLEFLTALQDHHRVMAVSVNEHRSAVVYQLDDDTGPHRVAVLSHGEGGPRGFIAHWDRAREVPVGADAEYWLTDGEIIDESDYSEGCRIAYSAARALDALGVHGEARPAFPNGEVVVR